MPCTMAEPAQSVHKKYSIKGWCQRCETSRRRKLFSSSASMSMPSKPPSTCCTRASSAPLRKSSLCSWRPRVSRKISTSFRTCSSVMPSKGLLKRVVDAGLPLAVVLSTFSL
jgi:hypothetical protein